MSYLGRVYDHVRALSPAWLLLPGVSLLVVLFLYPTFDIIRLSLFDPSLTGRHFEKFFSVPVYLGVFLRTVGLSLAVAASCFVLGYPVAYFFVGLPAKVRPYLLFLVLIPFWMSILIRTYAWMVMLGRQGLINSMLVKSGLVDEPLKLLFTTEAVYVAMVQILLPIVILTCYGVMVEIDRGLVKAARVLGASPLRAFTKVFFPLSLGGAATGSIIVFILSMGFFVTPALLGGRKDMMMANLIDFQVHQTLNWGFASAVALVLLAATLAAVLLFRAVTRTAPHRPDQ